MEQCAGRLWPILDPARPQIVRPSQPHAGPRTVPRRRPCGIGRMTLRVTGSDDWGIGGSRIRNRSGAAPLMARRTPAPTRRPWTRTGGARRPDWLPGLHPLPGPARHRHETGERRRRAALRNPRLPRMGPQAPVFRKPRDANASVPRPRRVVVEWREVVAGDPQPAAPPCGSGPARRDGRWRRTGWSGCRSAGRADVRTVRTGRPESARGTGSCGLAQSAIPSAGMRGQGRRLHRPRFRIA